jgi:hypothetical protein
MLLCGMRVLFAFNRITTKLILPFMLQVNHNISGALRVDERFQYGGMLFKKILANPDELVVLDKAEWIEPKLGDHVEIVSWDTQCDVQESVRLSKLAYLTVSDINPIVVGLGNYQYAWAYEICVEESHLSFLQWHYKILDN